MDNNGMNLATQFNRQYRRPYERSISERRFEDHRFPSENLKNLKDSSHFTTMDEDRPNDLRVVHPKKLATNGTAIKIKEEVQAPLIRRYFCIFCKMDFLSADVFLDHLETHPNGSFVLVKRDLPQLPPASPSPLPLEPEEISAPNSPILPEMLSNQIKIEPISDDEDLELADYKFNSGDPPPVETCFNSSLEESTEASDPNHQLIALSSPRIGDGPGEYLCNVCNAKFVYKNNLKSHLKRHLGIYPYICFYPSCGKRYQFKCKLNKHIEQAHAKIKNFQCPVPSCPKKYFTRNDLAFHISVTHQERQEIPCLICNKVFNSQKSLQIHCRKYHRNQES